MVLRSGSPAILRHLRSSVAASRMLVVDKSQLPMNVEPEHRDSINSSRLFGGAHISMANMGSDLDRDGIPYFGLFVLHFLRLQLLLELGFVEIEMSD